MKIACRILTISLLCILVNILATGPLFAHDAILRGRVFDAQTGNALSGATVCLQGTKTGALTDENGLFNLGKHAEGSYTLQVRFLGYQDTLLYTVLRDHLENSLNIPLQPAAIELAAVDIHSEKGLAAISGLDLHLRPIQSAQDMLRSVPGLFIAQHAGGGKAEQIFLRGFDIDHGTDIRISADGLPVNMVSHAHGQGYADLHFIIPETVREVEFAKGPYDAQQGDFATAGHVAFRSLNRLDHSLLKIESGSFNTWRGLAMVDLLGKSLREKGHSLYIAAEHMYSRGYFESPQDLKRTNAMLKYNGRISPNSILSASLSGFGSNWRASGQIPQRAVDSGQISAFGAIDPNEGGTTHRHQANVDLHSALPNGIQLRNQLFAIHYDFDLFSNFTFFLDDSLNGDQIRQSESRKILGYNLSASKESEFLGLPVQHETGASLRADFVQDVHLSHTANQATLLASYARGDVRQLSASAFFKEHIHVSSRFRADFGIRYDQFRFQYRDALSGADHAVWQGRLSPKLNLHFSAHQKLELFLLSGIGFHSNDTRVVVAQSGPQTLPRANGLETGFILKPIEGMILTSTAWALDMQQEFVYVGDAGVVEPGARSLRAGLDISLRYQILPWLFADVDYNFAHPRSANENGTLDQYIPLAPTHTSIGGISLQQGRLSASLRYRYLADRSANTDNSRTAEGYFLLNAMVQYQTRKIILGASIDNILGSSWKEAQFETTSRLPNEPAPITEIHFTPGAPRTLKISLGYKF